MNLNQSSETKGKKSFDTRRFDRLRWWRCIQTLWLRAQKKTARPIRPVADGQHIHRHQCHFDWEVAVNGKMKREITSLSVIGARRGFNWIIADLFFFLFFDLKEKKTLSLAIRFFFFGLFFFCFVYVFHCVCVCVWPLEKSADGWELRSDFHASQSGADASRPQRANDPQAPEPGWFCRVWLGQPVLRADHRPAFDWASLSRVDDVSSPALWPK